MKSSIYKRKIFCSLLAVAMLLLSCKKIIQVDLENADSNLVIEGTVTNSSNTQTVRLSRSVAITAASSYPAVTGADVTISSSDGKTYKLLEQQTPGTYVITALRGVPNITYKLNVVTDSKTYSATSTMPPIVKLDSIGLTGVTILSKNFNYPEVHYVDPVGVKNYYRFILSINSARSNDIYVANDYLDDGRNVTQQLRGNFTIVTGTRVTVEMQTIDANIYNYWNGLNQNENRGGASTTPANPPSNISNGALGYFSAHTVQQRYFVVP